MQFLVPGVAEVTKCLRIVRNHGHTSLAINRWIDDRYRMGFQRWERR